MRLLELKIVPEVDTGWGSHRLQFGDDITQLYGPNGCGKTPVIHSIAFALGYPVRFREDIMEHCASVSLKVVHRDIVAVFNRDFKPGFCIQVRTSQMQQTETFYSEADFSRFFFDFVGIPFPTLTDLRNNPAQPYVSTFLPLFYVDQDTGYTQAYKSPSSFLKDQYAEMVRLAIGVPPKHSYDEKKLILEKKSELSSTDRAIVDKEKLLLALVEEVDSTLGTAEDIERRLLELRGHLDELRTSRDTFATANSALSDMLFSRRRDLRSLELEINDLKQRINDFGKIRGEIDGEINTLSLNEESKRLFSSFQDICANPECGLFLQSSESYGKSLLYLRDQMKDLDRNTEFLNVRLLGLVAQAAEVTEDIAGLTARVEKEAEADGSGALIEAISEATSKIIDLQAEKMKVLRLERERALFQDLASKRNKLHDDIAALSGGANEVDIRQLEFKARYRKKIIEWLDVLSTKNLSRNISFDSDFEPVFGTEKINQFSGSTLLRAVLAVRAAFFELYLASDIASIKFLIFDTPRQQDIEAEHFGAFLNKLKKLVNGTKAQVIFSTTEYRYDAQASDVEWTPQYEGEEQNMFLGTIEQLKNSRAN